MTTYPVILKSGIAYMVDGYTMYRRDGSMWIAPIAIDPSMELGRVESYDAWVRNEYVGHYAPYAVQHGEYGSPVTHFHLEWNAVEYAKYVASVLHTTASVYENGVRRAVVVNINN